MNRKFIIFSTITLFLFVGLFTFVNISTQEVQLPSDVEVYTDETTGETVYELELDGTQDVETYYESLEVKEPNIYAPNGYAEYSFKTTDTIKYYRVYFNNTSPASVLLRTYNGTTSSTPVTSKNVSSGDSTEFSIGNATVGKHYVTLSQANGGVLTGNLQVRVSDQPL